MQKRRVFIRQLAVAVAVVAGGGSALTRLEAQEDAPPSSTPTVSDPFHHANFAQLIGAEFTVGGEDADSPTLTLLAATLKPRGPEFENFSLEFQGAEDQPLDDQIRLLHHPEVGEFEVFLHRLQPQEGHQRYYAVIYRAL